VSAGADREAGEGPAACRVILVPTDYERSRAFYVDAVGLTLDREFPEGDGMLLRVADGVHLELLRLPFGPPSPGARLGFQVASVDACHARMQRSGVACPPPERQPWGDRTFTVADPDGNALTFFQVEAP
jgi:catechol 2,3-dioxygenase-like lactoylglutathione lyase family enzyme